MERRKKIHFRGKERDFEIYQKVLFEEYVIDENMLEKICYYTKYAMF